MSVLIMSQVWDLQLPDSEKLVLLALADAANDEGVCWPSIATLARKCTRSERTVQGVIKRLVDSGHISRDERPGRGVFYTIHPRKGCTPAETAPPQPLRRTPAAVAPHPRSRCAPPPQPLRPNRKEPSRTIKEPSGRGSRLSRDWQPNPLPDELQREISIWPPGRLERELARFRDYWTAAAGARGMKRDWDATWRNWIRRALDDEQQRGGAGRSRAGAGEKPGRLEAAAAATAGAIAVLRGRQSPGAG